MDNNNVMNPTVETTQVSVAPATDAQVVPMQTQAPAPAGIPAGYISVQEAAKKRKGTAIAYGIAGAAAGAAVTVGVVAVTNKVKLAKAKKQAAQQAAPSNGISAADLANQPAPQPTANPVPNANPQANQPQAAQAQNANTNK